MLIGCAQNREVLNPMQHDTLAGAPTWALNGAEPEGDFDMLYFVGVSEEQALSEAAALDQAYKDAVRRVADYVGVSIVGTDALLGQTSQVQDGDWAFRTWREYEVGSDSDASYTGARQSDLIRNQMIRSVRVVDSWAVAERFAKVRNHPTQGPPERYKPYNEMRYAQVWKAKVLVGASRETLDRIKDGQEREQEEIAEIASERRRAVLAGELNEGRVLAQHNEEMLALDRQQRRMMIEDKPTFHFMNNTLWYNQGWWYNPAR
jgi:hypothetical protein